MTARTRHQITHSEARASVQNSEAELCAAGCRNQDAFGRLMHELKLLQGSVILLKEQRSQQEGSWQSPIR